MEKKKLKKRLFKELFFELIPSLFQLKFIFPAILLAGAAGFVGYNYGFDAGADSIICPELDCMECLDEFTCDDLQDFEHCFPCPECPDLNCITCVKGLDCDDISTLRPECDFYECPEIDCDFCYSLNCTLE